MQDLVGDRDLPDVVEHRRTMQVVHRRVVQTEATADGDGELGDFVRVGVEVGLPLVQRLQEHLVRLVSTGLFSALLNVQTLIRLS